MQKEIQKIFSFSVIIASENAAVNKRILIIASQWVNKQS